MAEDTSYNGWKNYATWNVALWIGNDEGLQDTAKDCSDYAAFVENMREYGEECEAPIGIETPDHVAWNDSGLDVDRLDEMIKELSE